MVTCYTLARTLPSQDQHFYNAVKRFPEVKEVIITYGEYDMIIKIEAETIEDLDDFIFSKLRSTQGIAATTSLIQATPVDFEEEA
jgi:anthranilate phosphoribosyltransferase